MGWKWERAAGRASGLTLRWEGPQGTGASQDSNGLRLTDEAIWSEAVWREAAAAGGGGAEAENSLGRAHSRDPGWGRQCLG